MKTPAPSTRDGKPVGAATSARTVNPRTPQSRASARRSLGVTFDADAAPFHIPFRYRQLVTRARAGSTRDVARVREHIQKWLQRGAKTKTIARKYGLTTDEVIVWGGVPGTMG